MDEKTEAVPVSGSKGSIIHWVLHVLLLAAAIVFLILFVLGRTPEVEVEVEEVQTEDVVEADESVSVPETVFGAAAWPDEYNLSIDVARAPNYPTRVVVRDQWKEDSGFVMNFPSTWGLVQVNRADLTARDAGASPPKQFFNYRFTSEFRPYTHFLTINVSDVNFKDHELVTQGGRVPIDENDNYIFQYQVDTDIVLCAEREDPRDPCLSTQKELDKFKTEAFNVITSFRMEEKSTATQTIESSLGPVFDVPARWEVLDPEDDRIRFKTATAPYEIIGSVRVAKDMDEVPDWMEDNPIETTEHGATVYQQACAPAILCLVMELDGEVYNFDWPVVTESTQPVPENLDGVWFPNANYGREGILEIARTFRNR